MNLLLLSDLHGVLPTLDTTDIDLVIIAGDLCPDFHRSPNTGFQQAMWMNTVFAKWMPKQTQFTWGNHDRAGHETELLNDGVACRAFVDQESIIGGFRFWFSPWSNKFGWTSAFMVSPEECGKHYNLIPEGIDVIVSHAPPYGVRDTVHRTSQAHLGSKELRSTIERVKPKLVVCGHIHGGYGRHDLGDTVVLNVALMDEEYKQTHLPVRFVL